MQACWIGAWDLLVLYAVLALFNAFLGEELLFRRTLLTRMTGVFGKWDWVANAIAFGLYHLHQPWGIPGSILSGLLYAFSGKQFRSTWFPVILHSGQSVTLSSCSWGWSRDWRRCRLTSYQACPKERQNHPNYIRGNMKTKSLFLLVPAVLVLASLACTFGQRFDLEHETESSSAKVIILNEAMPATKDVHDLKLTLAAGELKLTGGAQSFIEGQVHYSSEDWKPSVYSEGNSLTISQGELEFVSRGLPTEDAINRWEIKLGNVPMNLSVQAGAYDAEIDLSGIPIQRLDIEDGVSDTEIRFDSLNPETMSRLIYTTGASDVTFLGLANANFTEMTFEGKLGTYNFDFSGSLQQDATVNIKAPFSTVRILVPEGMFAEVVINDGSGQANREDAWSIDGDHYVNPGIGNKLTIVVETRMGSLYLVNE